MKLTKLKFSKIELVSFLYGLGSAITVRIIGIISLSEIFSLIIFPYIISNVNFKNDKRFYNLILFSAIWLIGVVFSDIYNNSTTINFIKGFFSIIPFLTSLVFSYWLISKNIYLIFPFLWGYAFSLTFAAGFGFDAFYNEYLLRVGLQDVSQLSQYNKILVGIINIFITSAISITFYRKYPRLIIFLILAIGCISLFLGSRSIFLINILAFGTLIFVRYNTRNIPQDGLIWQFFLRKKLVVFIVLILFFGLLGKLGYEVSVKNGWLGKDEFNKYQMQSSTKIGLFSGRGEFIASFLAIKDSPFFGHGSFAIDTNGYGYQAGLIAGYSNSILDDLKSKADKSLIPTHSHLFSSWVNYGFLGALFWIYIIVFVLFDFFRNYIFLFPNFIPYLISSLFGIFWVILFSPFSQKPYLAMNLIFFIVLMKVKDNYFIKH